MTASTDADDTGNEDAAGGTGRKVVAFVHTSIDGFTAASDDDVGWLVPHAVDRQMAAYYEGVWRGASTALMGRINYEGFHGFWPTVARDPDSPPRDRELATWLDTVEKVVFSHTLESAEWQNARVARDPATEVAALREAEGQDILVLNSASIIRELLRADLIDELRMNVLPSVLGAGLPLFDKVPRSSWDLAGVTTLPTGAVGLTYRRGRPAPVPRS